LVRRERPAHSGSNDFAAIRETEGILKPKPGEPSAFEESFKERARERRREGLKAAQYNAEFKRNVDRAEKIMRRYPKTLRALAK
jgi:hypothetical protein